MNLEQIGASPIMPKVWGMKAAGASLQEIAEVIGVYATTIRTWLHRYPDKRQTK